MNKKGFTLIELITSFALASVLIVLLFNLILSLKNTYGVSSVKTEMLINQSNLSKSLNRIINYDSIIDYDVCSEGTICYTFTHTNGKNYKLIIDEDNKTISFDNFVYKMTDDIQLGEVQLYVKNINVVDVNAYNSILVLRIPITNKVLGDTDYGINLIYQFNSNTNSLT